jgi:hypothetical protein
MPTVRWEPRNYSPHYYFRTLERFKIRKMIKNIELFMIFMIFEASVDANSLDETILCLFSFALNKLNKQLHRMRPSNMYPPDDFYPSGSFDPFWMEHEDLFMHKFRFRLAHYHRMLRAMNFEDKTFRVGSVTKKHKYSADLCLLVVLRRLSYPIRFYDMVIDATPVPCK